MPDQTQTITFFKGISPLHDDVVWSKLIVTVSPKIKTPSSGKSCEGMKVKKWSCYRSWLTVKTSLSASKHTNLYAEDNKKVKGSLGNAQVVELFVRHLHNLQSICKLSVLTRPMSYQASHGKVSLDVHACGSLKRKEHVDTKCSKGTHTWVLSYGTALVDDKVLILR